MNGIMNPDGYLICNQQEFAFLEWHLLWHDQRHRCGTRSSMHFCCSRRRQTTHFKTWFILPIADASSFPPFVDKEKPLFFFSSDICRWWRASLCCSSFLEFRVVKLGSKCQRCLSRPSWSFLLTTRRWASGLLREMLGQLKGGCFNGISNISVGFNWKRGRVFNHSTWRNFPVSILPLP